MLKRVEYFSQAREEVALETVYGLASRAAANNRRRGITGWMNYDGVCFFQCLEGDESVVDSLYKAIVADPRHHDIVTLSNDAVDRREFNDWSMHFSADSIPGLTPDAVDRAGGSLNGQRAGAPGLGDPGEATDTLTLLSLTDVVLLGGDRALGASEAITPAVEAAGRRWLTMVFNTFVGHMLNRQFASLHEIAAAIVEMSLLGNRRGPAVLPNLKTFLGRRYDLSQEEIVRAARTIHCAVHGRGDALDGVETAQLMTAITTVTAAIRGLADVERGALRKPGTRRMLINTCRAALNGGVEPAPAAGMKGATAWLDTLIAQSRVPAAARGFALGDARFED